MRAGILVALGVAVGLGAVHAQQSAFPRVALIHGSFSDFRHRDDYDGVMKSLGWTLDKWENKDFGKLVPRLREYDIILGTALFNYAENVQDFSQCKDALLEFMERGGAIVWTDTNYASHVDWLAKWGKGWEVGLAPCKTTGTPMKWLEATHPIFSAAAPIRQLNATWMHMLPGDGWQVLSRCDDQEATALFRTHGRGFMLLTSFWGYGEAMLRNIRATQDLHRGGVVPTIPDLTAFGYGDNVAASTIRNLTDATVDFAVVVETREPSGRQAEYRATTSVPPGETREARVTVPMRERGTYALRVRFLADGREIGPKPSAELTIPELITVTVTGPRYRGDFMLARAPETLGFHIALYPLTEKLQDLRLSAHLRQGDNILAELPEVPAAERELDLSLPVAGLQAGAAALEVRARLGAQQQPAGVAEREIRVVPPRQPQVFVDEDLNTRVNGELFFPIAVYHVGTQDFARVKELGFNTIQAWGTNPQQAKENLDAAQSAGLKVILEGVTSAIGDGDPRVLDPMIEAFEGHPALLAWYLTDEPSGEERLGWCRRVYQYLVGKDPHHPVFMTSCSPGEFARYFAVTDIFAVDPYPIPNSVVMVSDWMARAQEAVQGRKPVWLIPQLHNWSAYGGHPEQGRAPTPEEERNMVYQGLVWGSKAIFYYPWDDGCTGLKYDSKLAEAVKSINAELAALGPALLQCSHEVVARNDEAHSGLYVAVYRGGGAKYVIAVSVLAERKSLAVPVPGMMDMAAEVLFEGRNARLADGAISDEFAPLGVHIYRLPAL